MFQSLICGFCFCRHQRRRRLLLRLQSQPNPGVASRRRRYNNSQALFFGYLDFLSLEWFSFAGAIAYEKKRQDFVREFRYWWFSVNDIAGSVFFHVLIYWGFMCRNGARESKRRRWTTWFCLIKPHTISFFLKLQSISLSLLLSCLTDWGYVLFALHYFARMLLVFIVHNSLYSPCF